MARHYERPAPATSEDLAARRTQLQVMQETENLPEFATHVASDEKIDRWLKDQIARMDAAIRDTDEVLFDQASGAWLKAAQRVNEIIAEEYRQAHPDAESWDLRYFKWMTKIKFIRFESPLGEFYLVPRRPQIRPKAQHWYTADEMIDMLHPMAAKTIQAFGVLPVRPETLAGPRPGEAHIHITPGGDPPIKFDLHGLYGGSRHAGKGVR